MAVAFALGRAEFAPMSPMGRADGPPMDRRGRGASAADVPPR